MEMEVGDVIPVKMPDACTVYIEDLPTFRGKMGQANDNLAIKITEQLKRPEVMKSDIKLLEDNAPDLLEDLSVGAQEPKD